MANTKIRMSTQSYFDANVDVNNKNLNNVATATLSHQAVNKGQLDTAISGIGAGVLTPVADITALKAVTTGRVDKILIFVESKAALYRYDAESSATADDDLVVTPTDVSGSGRWLKMSTAVTDHNNLTSLQGGTTNEYYHLTSAEKTAATRTASGSQSGLLSSTDWTTFNGRYSTSNFVDRETPTGTKNGSNTTFTLANTPTSGTEHVYLNGILQEPGAGNDYTISGATITMLTAPLSTDKIFVSYRK